MMGRSEGWGLVIVCLCGSWRVDGGFLESSAIYRGVTKIVESRRNPSGIHLFCGFFFQATHYLG
jgi:hypothetical protein